MNRFISFFAVVALLSVAIAVQAGGGAPDKFVVTRFATQQDVDAWQKYTDVWAKGDSTIAVALRTEGGDVSVHIRPKFGDKFGYPFVGIRKFLIAGGQPVDMSAFKGLKIRIKGEATVKIQLLTSAVTDFNEFSSEVVGDKEWQWVTLPFERFAQSPYFGRRVPWSSAHLRGVQLHFEGVPGAKPSAVQLSEIAFYK